MNLNPALARALFAEGARPHQWIVSSIQDLEDVCQEWRLKWLEAFAFGEMVLWGNDLYVDGVTPCVGATPGPDRPPRYIYTTEARVYVDILHELAPRYGLRVCGYIHPDKWRAQYIAATGSSKGVGASILREVDRQGWDGLVIDGTYFSTRRQEVTCTLAKLGTAGKSRTLHQSVPGWATRDGGYYDYELCALASYVMTGETNQRVPASLDDPMWGEEVGFNWTGCPTIGMYKPNKSTEQGKYWDEHREEWYPMLPSIGCIARATRWTFEDARRGEWLDYYWPAYERACREYGRE